MGRLFLKFTRKLKHWWYKFTCWAWHRYTTVKPDNLGHGWFDRDCLMMHLAFQCLVDYIEKEEPFEIIQWDPVIAREILDLYYWWLSYREHFSSCHEDTDKEDEMLHRLINIRGHLWT